MKLQCPQYIDYIKIVLWIQYRKIVRQGQTLEEEKKSELRTIRFILKKEVFHLFYFKETLTVNLDEKKSYGHSGLPYL